MFRINSFINIPDKVFTDLKLVNANPDSYFINVENTARLLEVSEQLDFYYLNGVIYFEYMGQPLMDYTLWDLVDQLWAYILNVIDDFFNNAIGVTYFPDQPIKFEIRDISKEFVLFKLDEGSIINYTLPKKEFLNALLEGAENFYLNMNKAFGKQCDYTLEMEKIVRLRKKL